MRFLSDFLSGLLKGFHGNSIYKALRARKGPARNSVRRNGTVLSIIGRAIVSIFCIGIVALTYSEIRVLRNKSGKPVKKLLTEPVRSLGEILAIDPAAAARQWKYIVLHHSASLGGSAQIFDQWHREKGWRGLAYHFVIGNGTDQGDGVIIAGPRWFSQEAGAHANAAEYNEHGIGICLVGNFDLQPPTQAQLEATALLVKTLCRQFAIAGSQIVGHNQIRRGGSTACPGKLFSIEQFRQYGN